MNWAKTLDIFESNHQAPLTPEQMVQCRPILMAHYRVQLASLHHYSAEEKTARLDAIKKTQYMAQHLKTIYDLLDEPDDVNQIEHDLHCLAEIIAHEEKKPTQSRRPPERGVSEHMRLFILNTNLARLSGIRIARLMRTTSQYGLGAALRPYFLTLDQFINPLFLHLGWLFFTPRFLLTLLFFLKKIWNPNQKHLHIAQRLEGYFNLHRRSFEFASDTIWLLGGLTLCFILPAGAVIRPWIIWGMQTSDIFVILTRSIVELYRLQILEKSIANQPIQYQQALNARIEFEKNISYLGITNSLLMIIAVSTILPIVGALHPIVPLLGACLGILTTLRFYWLDQLYRQKTPRTQVSHLLATIKGETISSASAPSHHNAILTFLIMAPLFWIGFHLHAALAFSLAFFTTLLAFNPKIQTQTTLLFQTGYRHVHAFFNPTNTTHDNDGLNIPQARKDA